MKKTVLGLLLACLSLPAPGQEDAALPATVPPERIKEWIAGLGARTSAERTTATQKLIEAGNQVVPFLAEAIKSDDPEVSVRARQIMSQVGDGDVLKPDPAILKEVDELLAPVMSSGHGNLDVIVERGKKVVPALMAIARGSDNPKNLYAMIALTRIKDPRSFSTLARLLQNKDIAVHMSGYLSSVKDPRLLGEIIALWQKLGADASEELRKAVRALSHEELGDDPGAWQKWFREKNPEPVREKP